MFSRIIQRPPTFPPLASTAKVRLHVGLVHSMIFPFPPGKSKSLSNSPTRLEDGAPEITLIGRVDEAHSKLLGGNVASFKFTEKIYACSGCLCPISGAILTTNHVSGQHPGNMIRAVDHTVSSNPTRPCLVCGNGQIPEHTACEAGTRSCGDWIISIEQKGL